MGAGAGLGEGIVKGFGDGHTCIAIFEMDHQYSIQWHAAGWMGRGVGRMDTCLCAAECPYCAPGAITTLLRSNIKYEVFKNGDDDDDDDSCSMGLLWGSNAMICIKFWQVWHIESPWDVIVTVVTWLSSGFAIIKLATLATAPSSGVCKVRSLVPLVLCSRIIWDTS